MERDPPAKFDVYPSLAQYYGDESFYHAVVVAASRRGWFIAFSGFEEDGLQDTWNYFVEHYFAKRKAGAAA